MSEAMGSSAEVSGAAHLPEGVAGRFLSGALAGAARTVLRVEGVAPSVDYRIDLLTRLLKQFGGAEIIEKRESQTLWREIRDCHPFTDGTEAAVWRVSMAPTEGHRMVDAFRRAEKKDPLAFPGRRLQQRRHQVGPGNAFRQGIAQPA